MLVVTLNFSAVDGSCLKSSKDAVFKAYLSGTSLTKLYKTEIIYLEKKTYILLELHDTLCLQVSTFHNTFQKLNLECNFDLCYVLAYNCEKT